VRGLLRPLRVPEECPQVGAQACWREGGREGQQGQCECTHGSHGTPFLVQVVADLMDACMGAEPRKRPTAREIYATLETATQPPPSWPEPPPARSAPAPAN
jgi:hypothetical protein